MFGINTIPRTGQTGGAFNSSQILGTSGEINVSVTSGVVTIGIVDPVAVAKGGTGLSTVAVGDLLYGTGVGVVSRLPIGLANRVLVSDGQPGNMDWTTLSLTTSVFTGLLPVSKGGTASSTAAGARTSLGLIIGTDVQAFDTQLSSVAGLAYAANALKVIRVNAGETAFELAAAGTGTVTAVTATTPLSSTGGTTPDITLADTAVTPGSYSYTSLTVDSKGRLTSASNGSTPREVLTAVRTYYVRTDGSDSNTGLVDSAGGGFLTIQKAVDVASVLDNGGFSITIQVKDGTYTGSNTLKSFVGSGRITIKGNSVTPANVLVSVTSANAFSSSGVYGVWTIKDLEVRTTTTGYCIAAEFTPTTVLFTNLRFGSSAQGHLSSSFGAVVRAIGNYTISGGTGIHCISYNNGLSQCAGITITLSGTPAFSVQFAQCLVAGVQLWNATTFSGGATGTRYYVESNAVIYTAGGGATYLPGNAAGSTATGGQYA